MRGRDGLSRRDFLRLAAGAGRVAVSIIAMTQGPNCSLAAFAALITLFVALKTSFGLIY